MKNTYKETMFKVLNEIEGNLEYVEIEDLIKISGYSYFHFHRIFLGCTGESIKKYIKRLRMQEAALKLQLKQGSITSIAMNSGFNTPSSFNKAFKNMFSCSPSAYIKESNRFLQDIKMIKPIKIEEINEFEVYSLRHLGDYMKCDSSWEKLIYFGVINNILDDHTRCFGITYDDPDVVDINKLRYDACIEKNKDVVLKNDIKILTMGGGTYAKFLHKGSYKSLAATYISIYGSWIQENNIELRNEAPIEEYTVANVKDKDLRTEIWIAIV